ncbi:hypothetical protein HDU67_005425, partial [Dinochytrium kinnereticum]
CSSEPPIPSRVRTTCCNPPAPTPYDDTPTTSANNFPDVPTVVEETVTEPKIGNDTSETPQAAPETLRPAVDNATRPRTFVVTIPVDEQTSSRDMACQTDDVIIDDIPTSIIDGDRPSITQICSHIAGVYVGDTLVDGGSNSNLVTLSFLKALQRRNIPVHFTPFHNKRFSTGVGGAHTPHIKKYFEFLVVASCPRPIILGTPVINNFYMDQLGSRQTLRYFYYSPTIGQVQFYETPMKIVAKAATYKSPHPFVRVVVAREAQFDPDTVTSVMCTLDRLPDIPHVDYIVTPRQDIPDFLPQSTVYSHDSWFPD